MWKFNKKDIEDVIENSSQEKVLGGKTNLLKWYKVMDFIKREVLEYKEITCECAVLEDEPYWIYDALIDKLITADVKFPKKFPKDLDFDYDKYDENNDDKEEDEESYAIDVVRENEICEFFYSFFENYGYINSFRYTFITPVLYSLENVDMDNFEKYEDMEESFDFILIDLVLWKMKIDEKFAPKMYKVTENVVMKFKDTIHELKCLAYMYNIPLQIELYKLIEDDCYTLDCIADDDYIDRGARHVDYYMDVISNRLENVEKMVYELYNKFADKETN